MINSTFGAPLGGTTFGGQYGVESLAPRPIFPPNGGGGAGMYRRSMVVVALGVPGTPLICWAVADGAIKANNSKLDAALIPRTIFDNDIVCVPYCVVTGVRGEPKSDEGPGKICRPQ